MLEKHTTCVCVCVYNVYIVSVPSDIRQWKISCFSPSIHKTIIFNIEWTECIFTWNRKELFLSYWIVVCGWFTMRNDKWNVLAGVQSIEFLWSFQGVTLHFGACQLFVNWFHLFYGFPSSQMIWYCGMSRSHASVNTKHEFLSRGLMN